MRPGKLFWNWKLLAIALVSLMISGCSKASLDTLRIAINLWPGYEPLYLARDLGYFDDTPIQIVEYGSNAERVRAYRNGEIEMTSSSMNTVLEIAQTNPDTRVFLIADFSAGADVVLAQPEIQDLQSLKGKKIGLEASTLGVFLLTRTLEQVNLSLSDVETVSLEIPEQEAEFSQKNVDAVVTYGSTRANLLAQGAKPLFDTSQLPGEIVDVLIGSEKLLKTHPQQMKVLGHAWFRAIDYLQENPQDAARRIAKRQGITPEQFLESLEGVRFIQLAENKQLLSKEDPTLVKGTQKLSQFLQESDLLKQKIDPASLLENSLVKDIEN